MRRFKAEMNEKMIIAKIKIQKAGESIAAKLSEDSGNFLEEALKYIIGIVVGGLFLGGVYLLFKNVIIPALGTKVTDMFNYTA